MPVGPKERGDWWYANSRLAYSCLGIVAWGPVMCGHDQAAKTCYFSRVTSKKAEYTVACVRDFFAELPFSTVTDVHFWMDCGNHFRARCFLTYIGLTVFETYPTLRSSGAHFLCEHHGKGECDSHFAQVDRARDQKALTTPILKIADLVKACKENFEDRRRANQMLTRENYVEFVPPPFAEVRRSTFVLRRLGMPMQSCYTWKFFRVVGRKSLMACIDTNKYRHKHNSNK